MLAAGRLLARNGDTMNAFISPTLDDAADLLALARLDDDGAPPAVSRHSQPTGGYVMAPVSREG